MEGHAKKCVERYCEFANKTTQQLYKVSTPCIDDHHFKEVVPPHVATCSGPARAAERALPCDHRVRIVHATLHGSSLFACFCCGVLHTSTMCHADAATLRPVAEDELLLTVLVRVGDRSRKWHWIQDYDRQECRGFDTSLDPAAFRHHQSRQLFFQLYPDVVVQFRSSSNLDHEILAVGYCTYSARS